MSSMKEQSYLEKMGLLGPLTETGRCDDCVGDKDYSGKLVKRVVEGDNVYLCSKHLKIFKEPEPE